MNPISKLLYRAADFFNLNRKSIDNIPDVIGGYDIFRNMTWADSVSVTKHLQTYKKSLYVFACVSKIAQKTASIDFDMYRIKNRVGDTQELFVHEALDLIYKPNPWQTKSEFFEKFMINKKLAGEAFILKVRDDRGKVVELWNLRPDFMTVIKDQSLFIKGYEFQGNGKRIMFKPEDIIHDAYPNPLDDYGGVSALCAADVRVDTEYNASVYQKNFFKNNARPDFILSTDGKLGKDQKEEMKESWDKRHKGSEKSGKGAFLEGGLKYQQVSISQREMDYIESLRMTRDDILTAFGVPKAIIAITDDVNLANAKTAMEIFLNETIEPEVKRVVEKLNEDLIYTDFGDVFFLDYDKSFKPRNEKEIAEVHQIKIQSGTMLINEAREEMGMEPVVGGWSLYMPFNEVAVGGLPQNSGKQFKPKQKNVFRGRSRAMKYLEVREQVEKIVYKGIEKGLRKELGKKSTRSFIVPEVREIYYENINKSIDAKGAMFKPTILKYAEESHKRLFNALELGSKSFDRKFLEDSYIQVVKEWADGEKKLMAKISVPFIQDFLVTAGKDAMQMVNPAEEFSITDKIQKFIEDRAKQMANDVTATTVEKVSRTLAEGIDGGEGINKLSDRVSAVFDEFPTYRADMIARTEATAANNRGFMESYKQSGVANAKEWINSGDGRVRDEHQDGQGVGGEIVGVDEDFSNGLPYPSEVNCRCVLGPAFQE